MKEERGEPIDKSAPLDRIVMLLERLVIAVEKLTDCHEVAGVRTPFPWHEVSKRCRNNLRRLIEGEYRRHGLYEWTEAYSWPLTCEDLMKIGVDKCCDARNWGKSAAKEVDTIMDRLGFPNWMST